MAREKQRIPDSIWQYPYTPITAIKNMKKYGIRAAWSHDRERTKENRDSFLEEAALGVAFGVAVCVAVPIMIYQTCKFIRQLHKSQKADEGFYPEVHENKDTKKRY